MFKRFIALLVCFTFIFSNIQYGYAQSAPQQAGNFSINQLPVPGSMINTTPAYVPLTLKGLIVHPENALKFDFLMDTGRSNLKGSGLSDEALKIMKYFLTALTIPEDDLWVNLSPYEKGRIIQGNFGQTIMGRDLLAQDYILKQLTASLIYPEKALGKEFWQQVYSKASKEYGTTQIPVNTFNKVWIVPSEAVVWEHEGKVLIVKSHLKVMLEEDYLALSKHQISTDTHSLASNVVRTIVLPVLEKEVNEGKNFAQLRQMYQAMILATWYKKALRESILNKVYANQKKTKGVEDVNTGDVDAIYHQYMKAFKKGAFNYIKEDVDLTTGQPIPRKYFSGGFSDNLEATEDTLEGNVAQLSPDAQKEIGIAEISAGETIDVRGDITEALPSSAAMLSGSLSSFLQYGSDLHNNATIKLDVLTTADFPNMIRQWWGSVPNEQIIGASAIVAFVVTGIIGYRLNEYLLNRKARSDNWDRSDENLVNRHFRNLVKEGTSESFKRIVDDLKTPGQTSYFYEMGLKAIQRLQARIDKQLNRVTALKKAEGDLQVIVGEEKAERINRSNTLAGGQTAHEEELRRKTTERIRAEKVLDIITEDIHHMEIIRGLIEILNSYSWKEDVPWAWDALSQYTSDVMAVKALGDYLVRTDAKKILQRFINDPNDVQDLVKGLNITGINEDEEVRQRIADLSKKKIEEIAGNVYFGERNQIQIISLRVALQEGISVLLADKPDKLAKLENALRSPSAHQGRVNAAMAIPLGGISLNAKLLDLQIKRDSNGVPLPISQQPLDKINIQGFVPQIISIQPVDISALFKD